MNELFSKRVLPAVTFDRAEDAEPTAGAFLKAGLDVMEIPFRTDVAVRCIRELVKNVPEMHVGAGTIITKEQIHMARDSGAEFGLAPGFNPKVVEEAIKIDFPFIPGVMTPSELELAFELGCNLLKLFPISQIGGTQFVKAILGPYKHLNLRFIPMGGIAQENMKGYLDFNEVAAVGGSWMATTKQIVEKDFKTIQENVSKSLSHF
ncbi:MAG: bifunctional 4-hydroxy-2-oxoglutarate aldolase/2-dehydro-3-deoxy-phosphogluconate aldolase [Prolixibacteraceae bacterium]|nr:bifunctional 4-hydroxy-2-oxoglutarate aldolase/2-dehydro-3-deoxy-phosphogluconate aldolase [Prolixibacteraceae bacterium]